MARQFVRNLSNCNVKGEVPAGTQDGVNLVFTLANAPAAGVDLFVNGIRWVEVTQYTLSGKTITYLQGDQPATNDIVYADYEF